MKLQELIAVLADTEFMIELNYDGLTNSEIKLIDCIGEDELESEIINISVSKSGYINIMIRGELIDE